MERLWAAMFSLTEEERKSQRAMILEALKTPMTINELYSHLPNVSKHNIAPLVTGLFNNGKLNKIGKKLDRTESGIVREQVIWSSRQEHLQESKVADCVMILNSFVFKNSISNQLRSGCVKASTAEDF